MKKPIFYNEMAYAVGLILLAIGAAFMTKANFGMSMIAAPAYLLHLKLVTYLPFFSFGMAEYTVQIILLIITAIILREIKVTYLFSIVTALIYGLLLDTSIWLIGLIMPATDPPLWLRLFDFAIGMAFCCAGVSLLFHTYLAPEAYELFVKRLAMHKHWQLHKVKTFYDCGSCLVAIILSFLFFGFGHFEGVKLGTIFCAFFNGLTIRGFSYLFDKGFRFEDRFALRKYFE